MRKGERGSKERCATGAGIDGLLAVRKELRSSKGERLLLRVAWFVRASGSGRRMRRGKTQSTSPPLCLAKFNNPRVKAATLSRANLACQTLKSRMSEQKDSPVHDLDDFVPQHARTAHPAILAHVPRIDDPSASPSREADQTKEHDQQGAAGVSSSPFPELRTCKKCAALSSGREGHSRAASQPMGLRWSAPQTETSCKRCASSQIRPACGSCRR